MKKLALATLLAVPAGATIAWAATPSQIISQRQGNFKQLGRAFKAVGDELKRSSPSVEVLRTQAAALRQAADRVGGFFPAGTGPESGVRTGALPAIWQRNADFLTIARRLSAAAQSLDAATASGDVASVRAAVPAVGGACRTCHESFRVRD
jgi:cytochrome c556